MIIWKEKKIAILFVNDVSSCNDDIMVTYGSRANDCRGTTDGLRNPFIALTPRSAKHSYAQHNTHSTGSRLRRRKSGSNFCPFNKCVI